ncbi:MAG: hypothetical protein HW383_794 [Candidatus Magasanikbacteria bacterium]|nr:hypothetical protein [Candidatus Magasanikbacteria bacterium]
MLLANSVMLAFFLAFFGVKILVCRGGGTGRRTGLKIPRGQPHESSTLSRGTKKFMTQKRVFIIHGWGDNGTSHWIPWLKNELTSRGFEVLTPSMPETETPKIENWVPTLAKIVGTPDENTFFVGHSIGCQTIVRYFESLPPSVKTGGAVFVAGFFKLTDLAEEEKPIAAPWLETPIDTDKVKERTGQLVAIFSDNDHYVPVLNADIFSKRLGAKTIIEHGRGHFTKKDGVNEVPNALETLLQMTS